MIRAICICALLLCAAPAAAQCDDLASLRKSAAMGKLSDETTSCLAQTLVAGTLMTREQASNLLVANSFAKGDHYAWAGHVEFHLESINTSDCDLMFKYGQHLLKNDAPAAAVKWAESAEKHSYGWPAEKRDDKLQDLHRLKTKGMWAVYESLAADGGMKQRAALGQVQLASVEWMREAKKKERDTTEALDFCIRSGWTRERCEQQAAL